MRVRRQVRAKPRCGDDARKSYEMQAKIGAKSIEKSTNILSWAVLGVQSRCTDASGLARDRPGTIKSVPGAILGRPGRAKRAPTASKSVSEPVPRRSWTVAEQCPRVFGASSAIEHDHRTIFERFRLIAQKLRCMKNVAPPSVLHTWNEVSTERAGASKKLEKPRVSAPKIEAGSVRATPNRAPAALVERQNAQKDARSLAIFVQASANEAARAKKSSC